MKAITPIVSIVILLLITIALGGAGWTYLTGVYGSYTAKVIRLVHAEENTVIVQNLGTDDINTSEDLRMTIDGIPVIITNEQIIEPQNSGQLVFLPLTTGENLEVKIIGPGNAISHYEDIREVNIEDLVGYWTLDEGEGKTANDLTRNSFSGTLGNESHQRCNPNPCSPSWINGKFGKALEFDGSNDVVLPVAGEGTSLLGTHSGHTIEVWIRGNVDSGRQAIFLEGNYTTGYGLYLNDGFGNMLYTLHGTVGTDNKEANVTYPILGNLDINTWYHIVAVYNGTGNDMKLYLNGTSVGTLAGTIPDKIDDSFFGWRMGGTLNEGDVISLLESVTLNGAIDSIAIYDRALTPEEVLNHFNAGM